MNEHSEGSREEKPFSVNICSNSCCGQKTSKDVFENQFRYQLELIRNPQFTANESGFVKRICASVHYNRGNLFLKNGGKTVETNSHD